MADVTWGARVDHLACWEAKKLGLERPISAASLGKILGCSGRQIRMLKSLNYSRNISERIARAIVMAEAERGITWE